MSDPRFPFFCHRTLADVRRTATLLRKQECFGLLAIERHELKLLLAKARENNPPAEPEAA